MRGTFGQARIAGFLGYVCAAFHRQCLVSALVGNFGQQKFIEQLIAQFHVRQYRRGFDLRFDLRFGWRNRLCRRLCRFGTRGSLCAGREQQTADNQIIRFGHDNMLFEVNAHIRLYPVQSTTLCRLHLSGGDGNSQHTAKIIFTPGKDALP